MRLLIVNDDGPPSAASPYFQPFVEALTSAGHQTTVVIPTRPMSWIGKAHAVGQSLTLSKFQHSSSTDEHLAPWYLLDGSPASCVQIGLYHLEQDSDAFDLVISGPNHGRNASTLYNLSSGTVGAAVEAALCGKRAIALSFGSKEEQRLSTITEACAVSVHLIEHLARHWSPKVELYNVNIPMVVDIASKPIYYTRPSKAKWSKSSLFQEVTTLSNGGAVHDGGGVNTHISRTFRWAPELSDVAVAEARSGPGEDLWASKQAYVSITPMVASFAGVESLEGRQLKLE